MMMMKCKPGDLAIIIHDEYFPANIGAHVHVLGKPDINDYIPVVAPWEGDEWECQPLNDVWGFASEQKPTYDKEIIALRDKHLHPIRPAEKTTEQSETEQDG